MPNVGRLGNACHCDDSAHRCLSVFPLPTSTVESWCLRTNCHKGQAAASGSLQTDMMHGFPSQSLGSLCLSHPQRTPIHSSQQREELGVTHRPTLPSPNSKTICTTTFDASFSGIF